VRSASLSSTVTSATPPTALFLLAKLGPSTAELRFDEPHARLQRLRLALVGGLLAPDHLELRLSVSRAPLEAVVLVQDALQAPFERSVRVLEGRLLVLAGTNAGLQRRAGEFLIQVLELVVGVVFGLAEGTELCFDFLSESLEVAVVVEDRLSPGLKCLLFSLKGSLVFEADAGLPRCVVEFACEVCDFDLGVFLLLLKVVSLLLSILHALFAVIVCQDVVGASLGVLEFLYESFILLHAICDD
jgi:hypothetical protein